MNDITLVGLDVPKATAAVAVAEAARGGEVRRPGVFENHPAVLTKLADRLAKDGQRLSFCYEAGSCGYGSIACSPRVNGRGAVADPRCGPGIG